MSGVPRRSQVMTTAIELASGCGIMISVRESAGCITVGQAFTDASGHTYKKVCTVTCHATGRNHTWHCSNDKDCLGDCSDPDNPRGACVCDASSADL